MGTHNRDRRRRKAAKRARQGHESQGRATRSDCWKDASLDYAAFLLLEAAVEAVHHDRGDAAELSEMLATGPPVPGGKRIVASCVDGVLMSSFAELRSRDWRPSELQRVVERRLGRAGAKLVAGAMAAEWRDAPTVDLSWAAEVAAIGEGAWSLDPALSTWRDGLQTAIAIIGILSHLPYLPNRSSRPRGDHGGSASNDKSRQVLERVRGLLAKAESTNFPEEADALTAKAQDLLMRHSIDRAALDAQIGAAARPIVSTRRVWIDDPYVGPKARLLHVVAQANRCRSVLLDDLSLVTVVGNDDDLDTVEILFTSLILQATTQMTAVGAQEKGGARSRSRSFRQSFLVGFGTRIGQRLLEANERSEASAVDLHGSSLLPVLASRRSAADEAIEEMFPELQPHHVSIHDHKGWAAGAAAADLATLVVQPEIAGFAEAAAR